MSFANLSPLAVAGGIAALAAVLYVLQRLRIRFREQRVATLLFWKEALNEAPVRKLTRDFRHLWAYLLILAICSLLWLALAEPQWRDEGGSEFHVLLLDGSAGMARQGRFQNAVADLERDLARLPADRRQVIWSGAGAETLLNPGEHHLLLQGRLAQKTPEAVPASIARQLVQLAAVHRDESSVQVRVYGDAPVSAALLAGLPAGMSVVRGSTDAKHSAGNAGITALGVAQAASGEWGTVDLLFRVEGDAAQLPDTDQIVVAIDDRPLPDGSVIADADGFTYRIRDLPADGGLLSVAIADEDSLALDNRAQLRLPKQQPIRVQLSDALPAVMAAVLRADAAVELVDSNPDVVIRNRGDSLGGQVAALEFVELGLQDEAFVLGYPERADSANGPVDAPALLRTAVQRLGLDNIDATDLADATQRPVEVAMRPDSEWTISVWRELLGDDYNFVRTRSFPLFVAQSLRWLAGVEQWYPYLAAGHPVPAPPVGDAPTFVDAGGRALDTLGADFIPARADQLHRLGGEPLEVSLIHRDTTVVPADNALQSAGLDAFAIDATRDSLIWLPLLALLGLLAEWWLYRKGQMP